MELDLARLAEGLAFPGIDTRQWVSFGIVDQGTEPIEFETGMGPLVSVTLQPSGVPVVCRIANQIAGNGEGEYYPFVSGDEVIVLIPGGDERAGCTIIGRLNNELDPFPATVAGQDTNKNNFAFKRSRAPFIHECASDYVVRSAATGAFLSISGDGRVTLANADKAFLTLNPDVVGLQNGSGTCLMQVNLQESTVVLEAMGTKMSLGADSSYLVSQGEFSMTGFGFPAVEHLTTAEAVVNMLAQLIPVLGDAISAALPAAIVAPATGAPLGPLIGVPIALALRATVATIVQAMLLAAGTGNIVAYQAAIGAALTVKPGVVTGTQPSVGCPGLKAG